jgi:hypothetical protein
MTSLSATPHYLPVLFACQEHCQRRLHTTSCACLFKFFTTLECKIPASIGTTASEVDETTVRARASAATCLGSVDCPLAIGRWERVPQPAVICIPFKYLSYRVSALARGVSYILSVDYRLLRRPITQTGVQRIREVRRIQMLRLARSWRWPTTDRRAIR